MLLTREEEEEDAELRPNNFNSEPILEVFPEPTQTEISLNSIVGITCTRTMKLLGKINGK